MTATQNSPESRLELSYVTIGVLTALEEEYSACLGIFDPERKGIERQRHGASGTLTCWLCYIPANHGGKHVVAITRLLHMGNTAAAIAASILLQHCEAIESLIMCGIAGAVPHPTKRDNHVRLGDIVVSTRGIIQYDIGKQRDPQGANDDAFDGFEFRPPPRAPCPRLLEAVGRMHSDERLQGHTDPRKWEMKIDDFLSRFASTRLWKRPSTAKDKLIDTRDGSGNAIRHPRDPARRSQKPRVFRGGIGAANIVLADPKKRDALRDHWDIRAVEMEGSGIADAGWVANVGYLVVRGTCDYCNSTKSDEWHPYAAVIAAAYARTVIEYLHADSSQPREIFPTVSELPARSAPSLLGAPIAFSTIDTSNFSSDAARQSTDQHPAVGLIKTDISPALALAPVDSSFVAIPQGTELGSTLLPEFHYASSEHRRLRELNVLLKALHEGGRRTESDQIALELDNLLSTMPNKGTLVREGWLLLAMNEASRLRREKAAGRIPDVARLQRLRKEAENVID